MSESVDFAEPRKRNSLLMPPTSTELEQYRLGRELGRGGFGIVFEALNTLTGESVAVKRIPLRTAKDEDLRSLQAEINLLKALIHPNVVRYVGSIRTKEYLFIIMEYVEGGSLAGLIKRFGPVTEGLAAIYTSQILTGLAYLHEQVNIYCFPLILCSFDMLFFTMDMQYNCVP